VRDGDFNNLSLFYSSDGAFMLPDVPVSLGQIEISLAWKNLLATPVLLFEAEPISILVADSKDLAMVRGRFQLIQETNSGKNEIVGKYLVVWKNVEGDWKIQADIINSDQALS
jgi:ketosteroid isomerase-like protein